MKLCGPDKYVLRAPQTMSVLVSSK